MVKKKKNKNDGLKKTLLLIENMEFDIKYILIDEYFADTIRTESVKNRAYKYIKDKCNTLPVSIRNLVCNIVYRSYYKWLDIMLDIDGDNFEQQIIDLLNTDFLSMYDINGEIVSLRKQVENIVTYDRYGEDLITNKKHYLERKIRNANKKYLLCLKFGDKSKTIENLAYKYYNYIRNRKVDYDKYCKEQELKRSDWRCKILISQKFKEAE